MKSAKREQTAVNESGAGSDSDARLTHEGSGPVHGWLPIETAPKDGTKILAHWYGNDMPFISQILTAQTNPLIN